MARHWTNRENDAIEIKIPRRCSDLNICCFGQKLMKAGAAGRRHALACGVESVAWRRESVAPQVINFSIPRSARLLRATDLFSGADHWAMLLW